MHAVEKLIAPAVELIEYTARHAGRSTTQCECLEIHYTCLNILYEKLNTFVYVKIQN